MSPLLAEKYLSAAEQILDKAIQSGNPYAKKVKRFTGIQMEPTVGQTADSAGLEPLQQRRAFQKIRLPHRREYEVRIMAYGDQFGDEPPKMVLRLDKQDIITFDVKNTGAAPQLYKHRMKFPGGNHRVALAYTNNKVDNNNPDRSKRGDRNLIVMWMEIEGPFNAPPPPVPESHKRVLFAMPGRDGNDEDMRHQDRLQFTTRAFRRPATEAEVNGLLRLFRMARARQIRSNRP